MNLLQDSILLAMAAIILFLYSNTLSVTVLIVSPIHFLLKLVGTLTSFVLPALFYVMKMPRNASLTMACYLMLIGGLVFMVLIPYEVARNFMHKTA